MEIGTILVIVAVAYLGFGCVMALYEKGQTDNKFDWKTIFTWLYKIFK
jgi:hypothetical protein